MEFGYGSLKMGVRPGMKAVDGLIIVPVMLWNDFGRIRGKERMRIDLARKSGMNGVLWAMNGYGQWTPKYRIFQKPMDLHGRPRLFFVIV